MSGYGSISGVADSEALSRRLREAERARADAERAHADALSQLRNAQRSPLDAHNVEQLQSRVRELEKKVRINLSIIVYYTCIGIMCLNFF